MRKWVRFPDKGRDCYIYTGISLPARLPVFYDIYSVNSLGWDKD
jgi:hypothetical protein